MSGFFLGNFGDNPPIMAELVGGGSSGRVVKVPADDHGRPSIIGDRLMVAGGAGLAPDGAYVTEIYAPRPEADADGGLASRLPRGCSSDRPRGVAASPTG